MVGGWWVAERAVEGGLPGLSCKNPAYFHGGGISMLTRVWRLRSKEIPPFWAHYSFFSIGLEE